MYDGKDCFCRQGSAVHNSIICHWISTEFHLETVDPVEWEELNGNRYEESNEIVYSFGNGVNTLAVKFSKELTPKTYAAVIKAAGKAD